MFIGIFLFSDFCKIPSEIILIPQHHFSDVMNFTMTWSPFDPLKITDYQISISPSPVHGPYVVDSRIMMVGLVNGTHYNITITSSICSERDIKHYEFGKTLSINDDKVNKILHC